MVGRLAMNNPWYLNDVDRRFYGQRNPGYSRREILKIWADYVEHQDTKYPGRSWQFYHKPILNLFVGEKNCRNYRRILSDSKINKKFGCYKELIEHLIDDLEKSNKEALDQRPPSS